MLMSRGYLPYTKQFGVVTLTPKILFKNCKCTFSILSFLPTPQTSLQIPVNIIWIKTHVKQILIDQFIQNWRSEIGNSSRGHYYSLFKQEFCIEPYLLRLEQRYRIYITKFRLCNIRIPIETGLWQKITRENRKCTKCSKDVIKDSTRILTLEKKTHSE
jgi:hypothetical protein